MGTLSSFKSTVLISKDPGIANKVFPVWRAWKKGSCWCHSPAPPIMKLRAVCTPAAHLGVKPLTWDVLAHHLGGMSYLPFPGPASPCPRQCPVHVQHMRRLAHPGIPASTCEPQSIMLPVPMPCATPLSPASVPAAAALLHIPQGFPQGRGHHLGHLLTPGTAKPSRGDTESWVGAGWAWPLGPQQSCGCQEVPEMKVLLSSFL